MSATIQFLANEKGRTTADVLPIEDYEKRWDDMDDVDDLSVIAERRGETTIPHAEFKKGIKRNGFSKN
jgi:hypothetical protein